MKVLLSLILFSVLLNAGAQLLLKKAMEQIGEFSFSLANLFPIGLQCATNPFIILGLACYVVSVGVWLLVLSRVDVSFAYPMISIGYIVSAIAAYYLFNENLSPTRIAGIVVIMLGVVLITRT